ncbi:MAG: DMT family transporter [Betaproteobacteria bacterium]|uniref:DMT family transporter n=1 Tax=Candidatus Proximibacter danicus TaxID=2954365 RepID=A0A9D7K1S0_9PROT|nr:DMT family transporter [Candidatus Proximibacter danicus]
MTATSTTYLKLIGAMFMWGGTWIAGRIVAQEVPAPLMAAAFRFLIAGLVLAGFALATEGSIPRPADGREWGIVSGLAVTGIFLYALCFFYGLRYIPAGRGALVVALNPVTVVLVAWFAGQERMTPVKLCGVAIALAGCLMVIGNGDPLALLHGAIGIGEWLIVGCVLCWTAYTFIGRSATKTLSPLAATLYASLRRRSLLGPWRSFRATSISATGRGASGPAFSFWRFAARPSASPGLPMACASSAPPALRPSSTWFPSSPYCRPRCCSTSASAWPCSPAVCWSLPASG